MQQVHMCMISLIQKQTIPFPFGVFYFLSTNRSSRIVLQQQLEGQNVVLVSGHTNLDGFESLQVGGKSRHAVPFGTLTRTARPKPVYLWTVQDVQKWFRRHCGEYYSLYAELFLNNEITGRTLLRITEGTLLRLGINSVEHRQEVWREITKLRLKSDIVEIRDLERRDEI